MALVRGSNKSDTLNGKNSTDVIFARSGNDIINGKRGRDLIDASNGNDTVRGGWDNDTILGGSGTDTAVYDGSVDGISVRQIKGGFLQVRGPEGRDLLKSVEFLKIGDKTYSTKGPIARTDNAELAENQRVDINALANDQSLSKGALRIQKLGGGDAAVGDTVAVVDGIEVRLGADNRLTFDPGTTYDNLSAGETIQREFTYVVGNGSGHLATATVKLTIKGRNDGPVAVNDAAATDEGTPLTIAAATLLSNDTDIDRLDVLTVSAVAATADTHGTVSLENGQITYTPEAGFSGPASFTYMVSDGKGGTATATVNVEVAPSGGCEHRTRHDGCIGRDERGRGGCHPPVRHGYRRYGSLLRDHLTADQWRAVPRSGGHPTRQPGQYPRWRGQHGDGLVHPRLHLQWHGHHRVCGRGQRRGAGPVAGDRLDRGDARG
jgi:VCBS repeat-containing protein